MRTSSNALFVDNRDRHEGASPVIRKAESRDIRPLVQLGAALHAEGAYAFLPYDMEKCENTARFWIDDEDHLFLLAKLDGRVVGMLAMGIGSYFFCDELVASDRLVFVMPGNRGLGVAAALIDHAKEWARSKGVREFCLYQSTSIEPEAVKRLYESLGLSCKGGVFKERLR